MVDISYFCYMKQQTCNANVTCTSFIYVKSHELKSKYKTEFYAQQYNSLLKSVCSSVFFFTADMLRI